MLRKLAIESGFMQRNPKKIDALDFLQLMCMEAQKGCPSYGHLASRLNLITDVSASKQAFCKRVNESCVNFFKSVLAHVIQSKFSDLELKAFLPCHTYKRVLIQDSTIIRLPLKLFNMFSGVSNLHSSVCNARIQGVYDLLSGSFLSFSIDPYSKNDLKAAGELDIKQGDLVLRDRGYMRNEEIKRHFDKGADCIYRHRQKVIYLDPVSREPINLLAMLRKRQSLDIQVCLNDSDHTLVRLVAVPVSTELANERRRKLKREMRKHNPSPELLQLMSWTIFITTIPKSKADFKQLLDLYGIRWKIEVIFKIWKSHLHFDKIHNVSEYQLYVLLCSRFIVIVLYTRKLYQPCLIIILKLYKKNLSMMKFFKYLNLNPEAIPEIINELYNKTSSEPGIINMIAKYCTYDKRNRLNLNEVIMKALLS
jgi:hypothetical protein